MSKQSSRRSALKAVAAAGGFLAVGSTASAETEQDSQWPGEWLGDGKEDRPCAIFQYGRVLLVVNELMHLAVGRLTVVSRKIVVKDALVWSDKKDAPGFEGILSRDGKTITWQNGDRWRKA